MFFQKSNNPPSSCKFDTFWETKAFFILAWIAWSVVWSSQSLSAYNGRDFFNTKIDKMMIWISYTAACIQQSYLYSKNTNRENETGTLACMCAVDGEAKMVVRSGLKTEVSWLKKFIWTSLCRSSGFTALGNSFWSSTIKWTRKDTMFHTLKLFHFAKTPVGLFQVYTAQ